MLDLGLLLIPTAIAILWAIKVQRQRNREDREAHQRLRASNERMQLALASANLGLFEINLATLSTGYSEHWLEITGVAPETVVPNMDFWINLIHPDDREMLKLAFDEFVAGKVDHFEQVYRIRNAASQTWPWVLTKAQISYNDQNQPKTFIGSMLNITHLKRMEQSVLKANERLDLALKSTGIGIWDLSADDRRINWDYQIYQLHEKNVASFRPTVDAWISCLVPEDQSKLSSAIASALKNRQDINLQYCIQNQAGERQYIQCYGKAMQSNAGPVRLIGIVQDISPQIRTQIDLDAQRVLAMTASKMATLGEMSSAIAHEINNPLAIIMGRCEVLRALVDTNQLTAEKALHNAQAILDTTERIAKIIRGLRSFAREGSKDPFISFDANELLNEAQALCSSRFKQAGIDIKFEKSDTPALVSGQPVPLSQVLLNLVNNAFDAAIESAAEKWVQVKVRRVDQVVEISVTDSGLGIPIENSDKIMQPFFTTKAVGKGTGLGLSICTGIVQAHQGELLLDRSARNTTFVLRIPTQIGDQRKRVA